MSNYDLIIIGSGIAGLTSGIYASRSGLKTLILEKGTIGGSAIITPWIENYPGFPNGITGQNLIEKVTAQCKKFGTEIEELNKIISINSEGIKYIVKTKEHEYSTKALIISTGSKHKKLGIPGEKKFSGRGVSYCALCDGHFFKDKEILVVGGGNTAAMSAIYLSNLTKKIFLVHRRDSLRAEEIYFKDLTRRGVKFFWNTELKEISGDKVVNSVKLYSTKEQKPNFLKIDGIFILIGEIPQSSFALKAGIKVDKDGYIIVDSLQRTNKKGVYAAGDVTNCPIKQLGTAIGQAIIASTQAFNYIKKPYYYEKN